MKYIKPEIISLKNSQEFNEKWLQARIEEDPSMLGLGELDFRDTEKMMVGGGRLDTILYDPEYKTDESHVIRTIEYWDLERKKNPQYNHCAVIIAEDITSRFLNVISLFNGFIPLIAIQVKAVKFENNISLFFTKVLDEVTFELLDEDIIAEPTDKAYWEKRASNSSVKLTQKIFSNLGEITDEYSLKYNKHYIGIERNNMANNFISFVPRKTMVIMNIKHERVEEIDEILESSDLDILSYDKQWKQYRVRLSDKDVESNVDLLKSLVEKAKIAYHS